MTNTHHTPAFDALHTAFSDRLRLNEPLARHTSAKIGGPADVFLAVRRSDDLRTAANIAWDHDLPLFILGGGSNILFADDGLRGLVVYNRTNNVTFDGTTISADSGAKLQEIGEIISMGIGSCRVIGQDHCNPRNHTHRRFRGSSKLNSNTRNDPEHHTDQLHQTHCTS